MSSRDRWTYNADHRKRPNFHPVATPSYAPFRSSPPVTAGFELGATRWVAPMEATRELIHLALLDTKHSLKDRET